MPGAACTLVGAGMVSKCPDGMGPQATLGVRLRAAASFWCLCSSSSLLPALSPAASIGVKNRSRETSQPFDQQWHCLAPKNITPGLYLPVQGPVGQARVPFPAPLPPRGKVLQ